MGSAVRERAMLFAMRALLRALSATWRVRDVIEETETHHTLADGVTVIAFWHGRMLPVWYRFRGREYAALVSASRDGEILARYLERSLGYSRVIRGSTSKGGSDALRGVVDALASMSCLITPDGPRGPAREAKPGVLIASARSGRPILLVDWSCRRAVTIDSWDAMQVPLPFSRITFRYLLLEAARYDGDARIGPDQIRELEASLNSLHDVADG